MRFGDIATLVKGVSYASEDYCGLGEGSIFLTIKCVSKEGGFKQKGLKYFNGKMTVSQSLESGDLLLANTDLTRAGDIVGAPMLVPSFDGTTVTMSMDLSKVVEYQEKIDRKFLYYLLMMDRVRRFMKDHASGSTVLHLQTKAVPSLVIEVPNQTKEQTKIAEVLSTVDRTIEQTEGLIAKQQRIKTGLMQDLLTRGIDERGNLRSEETHEFKDSPLGRIPVGWEVEKLGARLKTIEQGWSPDCDSSSAAQGQWGVLKTTSVVWDGYQDKENKALPRHLLAKPRYEVKSGDVLMTRGGPNSRVGVVAYVYDTQTKLMLSDKLYRLVPNETVVSEFLVLALSSFEAQRHLSTLKTGLAESQTNISQDIVRELVIALPKTNEQKQIAAAHRRCGKQVLSDQIHLYKLYSLKTALMQDLLTGKVRVTPLLEKMEASS